MFRVPEQYRVPPPRPMGSTSAQGNNGAFLIPALAQPLRVIASDGLGWEHVSVSLENRCPFWDEMCYVKNLFWGEDDFVVQMMVPKVDYINCHPHCLHMWRKAGTNDFCDRPPQIFVGPKNQE